MTIAKCCGQDKMFLKKVVDLVDKPCFGASICVAFSIWDLWHRLFVKYYSQESVRSTYEQDKGCQYVNTPPILLANNVVETGAYLTHRHDAYVPQSPM